MRLRDRAHATVLDVAVVQGDPSRDRVGWIKPPVFEVLMPIDEFCLGGSCSEDRLDLTREGRTRRRVFAKEQARQQENIWPHDRFDALQDGRLRCHPPDKLKIPVMVEETDLALLPAFPCL